MNGRKKVRTGREARRWGKNIYHLYTNKMKDLSILFKEENEQWAKIIDVGTLYLPTGYIVISDPFQCCKAIPLKINVADGKYPVRLYLKDMGKKGLRVAFASILFSEDPISSWQPALTEYSMDVHFVDSGLSSFMDAETSKNFCELLRDFRSRFPKGNYYDDVLAKEFKATVAEKDSAAIGDWCLHDPFNNNRNNIPMFASGMGDGQYKAWWGLSGDKPVTLTIDFNII
jgi:hypothetical protein